MDKRGIKEKIQTFIKQGDIKYNKKMDKVEYRMEDGSYKEALIGWDGWNFTNNTGLTDLIGKEIGLDEFEDIVKKICEG